MLLPLEARAWPELISTALSWPVLVRGPRRGDGHPVLVMPGWLGGDASTLVLRRLLRRLGYFAHGWKLGRNMGPGTHRIAGLERRLLSLADQHGTAVSLIGWSLGGVYAAELGRRRAEAVRQVVTLASPLRAPVAGAVAGIFDRELGPARATLLPPPITALYSRTDGIVGWRTCLVDAGPRSESIEVPTSHCGMGHHPTALWVVAERLAQPMESWKPLDLRGQLARLFRVRPPRPV